MSMEALWVPKRGLAMCWAPIVLNALTTLAPGAQRATSSAAEVVWPSVSPDRSGRSGLVASTRILPVRSPAPRRAAWAAAQGVASSTTSPWAAASADAHRADDPAGAPALALDQGVAHHPGAAHAVRVADRDGAAVDVQRLRRDTEPVTAVDDLDGEGLVQLPEVDLVPAEAEAFEEPRHGEHGADPHLVGLASRDGEAPVDPEGREPAPLGERAVHQDAGGGAVGELARVAGRDVALLARHRLEQGEPLRGRVGAVAFVLREGDLFLSRLPG